MSNYGVRLDESTVRFEKLLPGPIDRVWEFITDGEKRARWLAGGETELDVGGIVELHFENGTLSPLQDDPPPQKYCGLPEKMSFSGRVTALEPKRLLAHTWESGDENSEVEYRLSEQDDKVLLTITHRRLANDGSVLGVSAGWHTHLDILADILLGKTPQAFWKVHTQLEAVYAERLQIKD